MTAKHLFLYDLNPLGAVLISGKICKRKRTENAWKQIKRNGSLAPTIVFHDLYQTRTSAYIAGFWEPYDFYICIKKYSRRLSQSLALLSCYKNIWKSFCSLDWAYNGSLRFTPDISILNILIVKICDLGMWLMKTVNDSLSLDHSYMCYFELLAKHKHIPFLSI